MLFFSVQAQINFEKGYIINNENQKTECLIRNVDWESNPDEIDYKISEQSDVLVAGVDDLKAFGIGENIKFISAIVDIDRSSDRIDKLSQTRVASFNKEKLFLKVLLEGEANLYYYHDFNLSRFFFNTQDSDIRQLVYKRYKQTPTKIAENNRFRQQLLNALKCESISENTLNDLDYSQGDLLRIFKQYSDCKNQSYNIYEYREKRDLINLSIRPRLNFNTLEISRSTFPTVEIDFGSNLSYGLGAELEILLPFNKNKWAFAVEPTFQFYSNENRQNSIIFSGGEIISSAEYTSLEVPIKARHYLFLNDTSKLFFNVSYILDFTLDSSIEILRNDGSRINSFERESSNSIGLGIGFKQNDKYSIEFRYRTNSNPISQNINWTSDYSMLSMILGYTLF
jgi:hypothetical protein